MLPLHLPRTGDTRTVTSSGQGPGGCLHGRLCVGCDRGVAVVALFVFVFVFVFVCVAVFVLVVVVVVVRPCLENTAKRPLDLGARRPVCTQVMPPFQFPVTWSIQRWLHEILPAIYKHQDGTHGAGADNGACHCHCQWQCPLCMTDAMISIGNGNGNGNGNSRCAWLVVS